MASYPGDQHHSGRDQPPRQQRRRRHQRPGQPRRAQQPPGRPLRPPRLAPPHLRRHPEPHAVQIDIGRARIGAAHFAPPLRRRAAAQDPPQHPPRPVGAALHGARRDPKQFRNLSHRPVLQVAQPPDLAFQPSGRAQGGDGLGQVGPGQGGFRRVPGLPDRHELGRQHHGGGPAAAQQQRGLPARDPPQPSPGRPGRPAGSRPPPATPPGRSPAGRPLPRRRAAPPAAGQPATAHAARTALAAQRRHRPPPRRSVRRRPSLLYCVLAATGSSNRRDSFALPCRLIVHTEPGNPRTEPPPARADRSAARRPLVSWPPAGRESPAPGTTLVIGG